MSRASSLCRTRAMRAYSKNEEGNLLPNCSQNARCTRPTMMRTKSDFVLGLEDLSRSFSDNDVWRHCVSGRHARHVRTICDAKVFDSIDLKLAVYDRHRIAPIFAVHV